MPRWWATPSGGEVARYIGHHGTKRVAKAVVVAAVMPIVPKSAANAEGLPMEVFANLRTLRTGLPEEIPCDPPVQAHRPSLRIGALPLP